MVYILHKIKTILLLMECRDDNAKKHRNKMQANVVMMVSEIRSTMKTKAGDEHVTIITCVY